MEKFDDILKQLATDGDERLLVVARFAELGVSASAVVHELRQPLAALKMALQMTIENAKDSEPVIIDGLIESLRLLGRTEMLLERARDFMNPRQGKRAVDVTESIAKVVSICQWQIKRHPQISIQTNVTSDIPLIMGEKSQVEQMMSNLVGNAVDAVMEVGEGNILIEGKASPSGGAELLVLDSGSGIDASAAAHVFEPFFSTKGKAKGTGLGLYIVSKMASDHDAEVKLLNAEEMDSLQKEGMVTGFRIRFPKTDEKQES